MKALRVFKFSEKRALKWSRGNLWRKKEWDFPHEDILPSLKGDTIHASEAMKGMGERKPFITPVCEGKACNEWKKVLLHLVGSKYWDSF